MIGKTKQKQNNKINKITKTSGHWIHECPYSSGGGVNQMGGNQRKQTDYSQPPPQNYVCHR